MNKKYTYKFYLVFALMISFINHSFAQHYNNEWIDYGKTYYKFKILQDSLYRIPQSTLSAFGITIGSQIQLWHNGQQVPVYVSNSGTLTGSDYVEFYGQHNDGSTDAALFKQPSDQINKSKSLETDSAAYYLTINPATSQNYRFTDVAALTSVPGLTPEAYFMYTIQNNATGTTFNGGPATYYQSDPVYMSDYQYKTYGTQITNTSTSKVNFSFNNLNPYTGSSINSNLSVGVVGNSPNGSSRLITVTGTAPTANIITGAALPLLSGNVFIGNSFQVTNNSYTVSVTETNGTSNDRCIVSFVSLTYPRVFNFGNRAVFTFNLGASTSSRLLKINGFNANGSTPVLYDITHHQRYTAFVLAGYNYFQLPAMDSANLVMVGQASGSYATIGAGQIETRKFTDLSKVGNQGNFLIISHQNILNSGNNVQQYADYRASAQGGSYAAKIYDIEDLEDQFAFGVHGHPLSIKNFLRYARNTFSVKPAFTFLIGRALTFNNTYGANGAKPDYQAQSLVPTYGYPASDILLASDNFKPIAATPIGRLSAVNSAEVGVYLAKVKTYELAQQTNDNSIDNSLWKKNMVFVSGASDAGEEITFGGYLNGYERVMQDTLFGGKGYYFGNQSSSFNTLPSSQLNGLFSAGMSFLSYYGHGASTVIGYTPLADPSNFDNSGRYPVIFTSGCDVGNCFDYMGGRPAGTINNITERYLLTPDKGSVGFVAQTFLGITSTLDNYNKVFFSNLTNANYGKPIFNSMIQGQQYITSISGDSITNLADAAQTVFLGDPSLALYHQDKPDFAVETSGVLTPATVSITDTKFSGKAYLYNLGRATGDSVLVQVQRKLPSGTIQTIVSKNIPSVRVMDSISFDIPVNPNTDAGNNSLIVTIDGNNRYGETTMANNSVTVNVAIYTNGLTPVYPYDFSIIHNATNHLFASTSNPLAAAADYVMEIDTTKLFNSSFKKSKTVHSTGGVIEFDPGFSYKDSTVYYWRVSPVPASGSPYAWANSSFQYMGSPNTSDGQGQSHLYQHFESDLGKMTLDSTSRIWNFGQNDITLVVYHATPKVFTDYSDFLIQLNQVTYSSFYCLPSTNSIMFNVFNPGGFNPYFNQATPSTIQTVPDNQLGGFMGSVAACGSTDYSYDKNPASKGNRGNFQFPITTTAQRNTVAQFMNWIPDGSYVIARLFIADTAHFKSNASDSVWQADGTDTSTLYGKFIQQGLTEINSFNKPSAATFIFIKNGHGFVPIQNVPADKNGQVTKTLNVVAHDSTGSFRSPKLGPALAWKTLNWKGSSLENPSTDTASVNLYGWNAALTDSVLLGTYTTAQQSIDISGFGASQYPYMQLQMNAKDVVNYTPYQLKYWHLLYTPVPEGALAANIKYTGADTINAGQDYNFSIAFKNISDQPFADSILANVSLTTGSNVIYKILLPNLKKLNPGDTATVNIAIPGDTINFNQTHPNTLYKFPIDTKDLSGAQTLSVDINPNNNQPEETHNNNVLYKSVYIKSNTGNANLDVTFDGVHILNNDIISAKPDIVIHVTSDAKYVLLNDTSTVQVSLKYPDGTIKRFYYTNDTILFTPAKDSSNNEAVVDFKPYLTQDGTYELIVNGQQTTGTNPTTKGYSVSFQVYNKPMISDMFNYPNPFTSSTAFVFTITGSEVPQNVRIEILTITGKIVKEITRAELGNLHVGRNITDYKWDGTDMYGQKLANGVYIYRVITNENGKSLDHFNITDENGNSINTGKYFNKGYGKMYLMR